MNKQIGMVLVIITLASLTLAIVEQVQLRKARRIVAEDLSGNTAGDGASTAEVATAAAVSSDAGQLQTLQRQMAAVQAERDRLRADLAAAQAKLAKIATNAAALSFGTNAFRRASFEERMAQLKTDDPARYAEMQKQRDDFRQRMQTQAEERAEFLKNIDTAGMTDEQRANHEKLVQAVEQARTTMAQIANMSPEDAAAARQQMAATMGTVTDLYQQERRYLLEQTGRAMGYQQDSDIGQFADYLQQIYDQTSIPRGFGRGGGAGGPNAPAAAGNATTPAR